MKTTGMIRQLDSLGRVVLPIELRRSLGIGPKDMLEIMVEDQSLVLRKYETNCHFCGGSQGLSSFMGKMICRQCIRELKNL